MNFARASAAVESAALAVPVKAYTYRFWLSLVLLILLSYYALISGLLVGVFVLSLVELLLCADILWRNAWQDLEKKRFSFSVLVCGSVVAGFGYSVSKTFFKDPLAGNLVDLYLPTGLLLTLYLYNCMRNARSQERTRFFVEKLDDFLPKSGRLLGSNQRERMVFARELKKGDIICIKPGERVPCEGIIVEGETTLDESLITGNITPAVKQKGSPVYAGTLNKTAVITVRVEKGLDDSEMAGIISAIAKSEHHRYIRAEVLDRYAPWLILCSVVLAVAGYLYFYIAGNYFRPLHNLGILLLIAGLGCPLSLFFAVWVPSACLRLGAGRRKIDIHVMSALEILDKSDVVFFDKTGTLTYGELTVTDVHSYQPKGTTQLLTCLATAEQFVDGPFAKAVLDYARKQHIEPKPLQRFEVLPGMGVCAIAAKSTILAGRPEWLQEQGIELSIKPHAGQTVICVAKNGKGLGYVLLEDKIREGATKMIASLHASGKELVLMSGDNELSVQSVAERTGIERYNFGVLPQTKAEIVGNSVSLGKKTVMIGDGFNDITALLRSDAGIVFSSGKNVYNNWVDVVVRCEGLDSVAEVFGLYRRLLRCVRGNIILSQLCNIALIAAVLFAPAQIWQSYLLLLGGILVGVMVVLLNSMRLLYIK